MPEIADIPADETVTMTFALMRAFRIEGCNPACHCCGKKIEAGAEFKLAFVKTIGVWYQGYTLKRGYKGQVPEDEMLCDTCTVDDLITYKEKCFLQSEYEYEHRYRGYTRSHV